MNINSIEIKLYHAGFCKNLECVTQRGGRLKTIQFPALVALITCNNKSILFDTGYSQHFFDSTKKFPEKLYKLTTPVTLGKSVGEIIDKENIDTIFLSHLHADHIGGVKDFRKSKFICSKEAYDFIFSKKSLLSKVRKGIIPSLLPEDFDKRVRFIESLEEVVLPSELQPFTKGYRWDIFIIIPLPGHAIGQYGLYINNVFFIADAVWSIDSINANVCPSRITHMLLDDVKAYYETIKKLKQLRKNNNSIKFIPSHCSKTHDKLIRCEKNINRL